MRLRSAAVRMIERPPRGPADLKFDRMVIGWNGSIESTHAIHRAPPFLQDVTDVLLINGEKPEHEDASDTAAPRFDPLDYLKRHRVAVSSRRLHELPQQVGAALLKEATAFHADLLVMGAFTRPRLRERILGGATRHVLEHAAMPVLMQH